MKFFFDLLIILYFLTIIANRFQTFDFMYAYHCVGNKNEGTKYPPKKKIIMKDLNNDELVLHFLGVLLEVNHRGEIFNKTTMEILEITYKLYFHFQHKNQSNVFKNQVIFKPK
jgi:hypothetical protein